MPQQAHWAPEETVVLLYWTLIGVKRVGMQGLLRPERGHQNSSQPDQTNMET